MFRPVVTALVPNRRWGRPLIVVAFFCVTSVACGGSGTPTGPGAVLSQTARAHLEQVVGYMQERSLRRLTIDWTDFRTRVFAQAGAAQTIPELHAAISLALSLLNDGHSFYRATDGTVIAPGFRTCEAPAAATPSLPGGIGYVRVPSFSGSAAEATNLANAIQQAIREADRDDLAGWIVDVRGNVGGNMWPMIAGVGPVLGTGVAGYFTHPSNTTEPWGYQTGASWYNNSVMQPVGFPYRVRRERPRVAVLTDNAVASSGEAVVIAFRGRTDTRSFGTPTCGRSSANQGFALNDGAMLLLTVAVMADRTRTAYGDRVEPDERVTDPGEAVERAVAWLRGR